MTATVQAPERRTVPPRHRAATGALASVEGRRLLRHPIVLAGTALTVFLLLEATWGQAPVLQRDAIATGAALFPLAAATLLAVNLAVLRSRRHGADELYTTLLTAPHQRTAAHLVSVAWPVALGVALVAADLVYVIALGAVGSPDPFELATGPAIVALAGAVGVLLARVAPSTAAAPLALVAFGGVFVQTGVGYLSRSPTGWDWLQPWINLNAPAAELAVRPAGWHLVYLGGLAAVAGVAALARHGLQASTLGAGGLALAVAVGGAVAQADQVTGAEPESFAAFVTGAASTQSCETRGTVEYCAYHDYRPWIDRWDAAVRPVLERLPDDVASQRLAVRQLAAASYVHAATSGGADDPANAAGSVEASADVRPTVAWGRASGLGDAQLALATVVASRAVGLPTADQEREPPAGVAIAGPDSTFFGPCAPIGEARAVVALWLAAQATPQTEASLRAMLGEDPYGISIGTVRADGRDQPGTYFLSTLLHPLAGAVGRYTATAPGVEWPWREAAYAVQLLDRPDEQVAAAIHDNWDRLTDPSTTTDDLATALNLERVPTLEEALLAAGTPSGRANELADELMQAPGLFGLPPCA